MTPDRGLLRLLRSVARRRSFARAGLVATGLAAAACGADQHAPARSGDPAVQRAEANVASARASPAGYRGPARGPQAQRGGLIVFVAGDLTNGGIAGAALGVQQGASAIGWRLQILDGQGTTARQALALRSALRLRPAGIVLGGFDAAAQALTLRRARALGIPVVGWHAGTRSGPDRRGPLHQRVDGPSGRGAPGR